MTGETWLVYILRCADGSLYTGITNDLEQRSAKHNAGTASRYTRSRRPVTVIYEERQPSRSAALKREAAIKALSRSQKEELIGALARERRETEVRRERPSRRSRSAPS